MHAIVVVPTYEEIETLAALVDRVAPTGFDLLVVDDESPDGTGALADELAAVRPWMHVMHRSGERGLGHAYRAGFVWALARDYDVIAQMDADGSHPPESLATFLAALEATDAGLVLGTRYARGGSTEGWSPTRRALSRLGVTGSRLALGLPYTDLSGGFKLWRASTLARLDLDRLESASFAFQVESTQAAHTAGAHIIEVPFAFAERTAGHSKMSPRTSIEGIRIVLRLRRTNRASRPARRILAAWAA